MPCTVFGLLLVAERGSPVCKDKCVRCANSSVHCASFLVAEGCSVNRASVHQCIVHQCTVQGSLCSVYCAQYIVHQCILHSVLCTVHQCIVSGGRGVGSKARGEPVSGCQSLSSSHLQVRSSHLQARLPASRTSAGNLVSLFTL